MRKQALIFVLFAAAALSMCACSNNSNKEKETVNLDEFTIPALETKEKETQEADNGAVDEDETIKEKVTVVVEEAEEYSPGVLTDTTYTNEYFGIEFEVPEGAQLFSEDEMSQLLGNISDSYSTSDVLDENYEMYAMTPNGSSINVVATTLSPAISDKNFVEMAMEAAVKSTGYNIEIVSMKYGKLAGKKAFVADVNMEVAGIKMKEKLYIFRKNNKALGITIAAIDGFQEEIEMFVNSFLTKL